MMAKIWKRIKEFVKSIFMNNFLYKLLSLGIAVMIWLIIINVADPVTIRNFSGLEVNIINQSAITSINQVYEVVEGQTVDFTVRGKTSVIKNLNISDFSASADLSKLSSVFAADIVVKCDKAENIEINTKNRMLIVKLEDVATKNMQVTVDTIGEVADGYYVDDFEVKPNIITVSGGKSKIERIDSVKVDVDVSGAKKNFSSDAILVAYDEDGNKLDSSYYTFLYNGDAIETVNVGISIYNTKEIPVEIDVKGTPQEGYVYNNEYEFTPTVITVGGPAKRLSGIERIVIPVDISGASEQYETNVVIMDYLPNGVKLVSSENNISIRIQLDSVITSSVEVSSTNITIKNRPDDMNVYFPNNDTFLLELKGTDEQIRKFTGESIGAYVDLSEVGEGTSYIQVQYDNVPKEIISSEPYMIEINVSSSSTTAEPSAEPSATPVVEE